MTRLISAILLLAYSLNTSSKTVDTSTTHTIPEDEGFDNNIIDFDEEYIIKYNKKYDTVSWHGNDFNRNAHKYTIVKTNKNNESYSPNNNTNVRYNPHNIINRFNIKEESTTEDFRVIPIELVSTTENALLSIIESTTEEDLTVIPLSTLKQTPSIKIEQTVTLPLTTETDMTTETTVVSAFTTIISKTDQTTPSNSSEENITTSEPIYSKIDYDTTTITNESKLSNATMLKSKKIENATTDINVLQIRNGSPTIVPRAEIIEIADENVSKNLNTTALTNITDFEINEHVKVSVSKKQDANGSVFTELDAEEFENIPEDYYDSKDILPTSTPKTDAISVLFGLAGSVVESVVESVAEKVVPKSIYDLFKRMQKQNEALEAERLRSREENGGIGQFGRGILKSLSSGLGKPLSQLMAGVKEAGSLDTDRGFLGNVASSVTSVANAANTYLEAFKDKVQAIYPGTVWCGDGHSAQARSSSELGLFFFTDTCCRQHDACKIYIRAGETKYGLTNTGLFTRSHCSCDTRFRECLRRTNSLVSAQIGLTYFNVLSPQCFRRAHPILKCNRRTRLTGQKCEEYELDYTKPKMWQWFDNETF